MRRQGPFTARHMVVATAVVAVIVVQVGWWLSYALRENRTRFELEQRRLAAVCAQDAIAIRARLAEAYGTGAATLAAGFEPATNPPPPPFTSWQEASPGTLCEPRWEVERGIVRLNLASAEIACVQLAASSEVSQQLLAVSSECAIDPVDVPIDGAPEISGDAHLPFSARVVARPELSAAVRTEYRRRATTLAGGTVVLVILLSVTIFLLSKTWRREAELEHQHHNFLSAITHELKSPLAAMRLSLETVLRGRADGTASLRFLENALQDTERLQSLVQKVLEVTRYGGTEGALTLHRTNLSEVVGEAVTSFGRRATAMGAEITVDVQHDVWVELDEEAFLIAFTNLLENAIKYGGTVPRVEITLAMRDGMATVDVKDNGKGMAFEELDFIFDRFYRCGDEMTRIAQGTGLGLYLVKQIVAAHSGTVAVHETGPHGSTFRITLPDAEVWEDGR